MFGRIIESPYTWATLAICVAGGWYAKRNFVDGLIVGWFASLLLFPVWVVMGLASVIPYTLLELVVPSLFAWVAEHVDTWPEAAQILAHPATVLTAIGFVVYCRIERGNSGTVPAVMPRVRKEASHNAFSYPLRRG